MRFFDKFANIYGIHFSNNETNFDKIDKNLIRYFKVEFGSEWESALLSYLEKQKKEQHKKAA